MKHFHTLCKIIESILQNVEAGVSQEQRDLAGETEEMNNVYLTSFQKLEKIVGMEVTKKFLNEVDIGNISKTQAGQFAYALHNKVGGKFKRAQGEVNFLYCPISGIPRISGMLRKSGIPRKLGLPRISGIPGI